MHDFSDRFQDFEKISKTLRLVAFPHLVETESAPMDLQTELVKIKNDEHIVQKFKTKKICWKHGKVQLNIQCYENWQKKHLLFLEALVCESAFLKMKYLKNEYRTRLLDSNLESELRLMVSNETPDFASLSARTQSQGSH